MMAYINTCKLALQKEKQYQIKLPQESHKVLQTLVYSFAKLQIWVYNNAQSIHKSPTFTNDWKTTRYRQKTTHARL